MKLANAKVGLEGYIIGESVRRGTSESPCQVAAIEDIFVMKV